MSERCSTGSDGACNRSGCLLCGSHCDLRWWEQAIETLFGTGACDSGQLIGEWMRMNFAKVEVASLVLTVAQWGVRVRARLGFLPCFVDREESAKAMAKLCPRGGVSVCRSRLPMHALRRTRRRHFGSRPQALMMLWIGRTSCKISSFSCTRT